MADKTPNYDLTKPLQSDFYDVDVQNENMDKIDTGMKENADGIAALQTAQQGKADLVNGKVPAAQLPSFVDDVIEGYLYSGAFYEDSAHTKVITPETGKIYTDLSTNKTYRWGGSAYVEISQSLALGETASTAYPGNKGKEAHDHISDSVVGEAGVHELRYYDNKLQVRGDSGQWETASAGGGVGPQVIVNVTAGSTVTCTDGEHNLSAVAGAEGTVTFDIPNYGTWNITGTLNGQTTATETLVVDTAKLYTVGLSYFRATLTVNARAGSAVTVTNGTKTQTATATSSGRAVFTLTVAGTYSVYAQYDGVQSSTATVNATTDGGSYTATVNFITLTVTVDSGSAVTVSQGSVTKTGTSVGAITFYLPSTGTWTITATLSGQTATDTISISSYSAYSITLNYFRYYGIKIQISNSDPASAVTYMDDAVGMSTGYAAWQNSAIFKNIKPCVVLNGVVQYYLDPTNFAYKADGTAATITSESAGDVMIEIPKLGYKMTTDGSYHYIWVTDDPAADGYCYRAHSLDSEGDCDKIYIGAYLGYVSSSRLYSLSGKSPTVSTNLTNFRTYAQARGTGYQLVSFYPLTLLQCLFLIMYKNRNGQSALGYGYANGNSAKINTGGANARGMCYGETGGKVQMCFLGIEDFWGNLFWWIDGIFCDSSRNILTAYKSFSDSGTGYAYSKASGLSSNIGNWMSDIQGTNEGGFTPKAVAGSATTYYADRAYLYAGCCAGFGGAWSSGDFAGPFRFGVGYAASNSYSDLGARLMYKKKAA